MGQAYNCQQPTGLPTRMRAKWGNFGTYRLAGFKSPMAVPQAYNLSLPTKPCRLPTYRSQSCPIWLSFELVTPSVADLQL